MFTDVSEIPSSSLYSRRVQCIYKLDTELHGTNTFGLSTDGINALTPACRMIRGQDNWSWDSCYIIRKPCVLT